MGGVETARRAGQPHTVFTANTPYSELEREHRSLCDGLTRLRAAVSGPGSRDAGSLRPLVELVREKLSTRFAFEERMGHMHYLHALRPSLQPRIARLRAEHREMLATLDRSAATLRSGAANAELGSAIRSMLDRFDRHELEERQLLRSALLRPDPPRAR